MATASGVLRLYTILTVLTSIFCILMFDFEFHAIFKSKNNEARSREGDVHSTKVECYMNV